MSNRRKYITFFYFALNFVSTNKPKPKTMVIPCNLETLKPLTWWSLQDSQTWWCVLGQKPLCFKWVIIFQKGIECIYLSSVSSLGNILCYLAFNGYLLTWNIGFFIFLPVRAMLAVINLRPNYHVRDSTKGYFVPFKIYFSCLCEWICNNISW